MHIIKSIAFLIVGALFFIACNSNEKSATEVQTETKKSVSVKEAAVNYSSGSAAMNGFVAYDESTDKKRPVVLIVHEWWGLNEYAKSRARQLAELGYLAMAVDMYGNGAQGEDPKTADSLAKPFYQDPAMAKERFDAALSQIKAHPAADTNNIAAIGYCFGGAQVLNIARLGENLNGVVSFHGNLVGVPPVKNQLKANVLVCHGEADQFVSAQEVATFKKQMDSIGARYTFKSYPNAQHAFTNPEATAKGQKYGIPVSYNAAADSASWNDMKVFFGEIFSK